MMADVPALMAALKGIKCFSKAPPSNISFLPQLK
jgi:hypothetical protein